MGTDIEARADQLAELMDEFRLEEARLEGEDWKVAFRKNRRERGPKIVASAVASESPDSHIEAEEHSAPNVPAAPAAPKGMPVSSPMTGIYYASPNPNAPPFVREGDTVSVGHVVGLIEAMKVFNEIVAPVAGTVTKITAKNGDVVNPGEPLLYIG